MTNHLLVKCFLVVVFLVVVSADSVEHVILWDTYNTSNGNTNFLFRGGNPDRTKDGNYYFDYDLLTSSLQEAAATAGFNFPLEYYLMDISFLNDVQSNGAGKNNAEFEFFDENPDKGEYVFWEVRGMKDDPLNPILTDDLRNYMAFTYPEWNQTPLEWRMEKMRSWLHTEGKKLPIVLYGHCDCGCDRTGEMFGAYALRYLGYSWEQISVYDQSVPGRNISCDYYLGMMWYCLSLKMMHNDTYGGLDCLTSYQPECNYPYNKEAEAFEEKEVKSEEKEAPTSTTISQVYYVDSKVVENDNENFLFRGGDCDNLPNYEFNYNGVVSSMQYAAKQAGKTLPSSFYLIDISTFGIHNGHDINRNLNEFNFFAANKSLGTYLLWEVYGEEDDPLLPTRDSGLFDQRVNKFQGWSHDLLNERVGVLKDFLMTEKELPLVIFAHDHTGHSEISDLMGAYYLKELGMSWKEVNNYNKNIHGDISCDYYYSNMWFCFYLQQFSEWKSLDCSYQAQPNCHEN